MAMSNFSTSRHKQKQTLYACESINDAKKIIIVSVTLYGMPEKEKKI